MNSPARPKRLLLVSSLQVHPTLSGGNLRTFALANALMRRGAEVFVYSFVGRKAEYLARTPSGVQVWPGGINEYVNRSTPAFVAGYGSYWLGLPPLWLTLYLHVACKWRMTVLLPRLLREKLQWCDAVIADFPFMYPVFGPGKNQQPLRILNLHNVEHHLYEGRGGWRDRLLRRVVRRTELAAASSADVVVSCSEADQRYFDSNAPVRRSLMVPNGIDLRRFQLSPELRARTREMLAIPAAVKLFLFTASKWGPNQEAFEFLLSFAKANERQLMTHGIHLLVVGNVVSEPIRMAAFTATGKVDVVEPYFAAADAAINPLNSGAGTNVKMGEFIAARLPVLVSSFGARGYRMEHGRTGFIFERENLLEVLLKVRELFDADSAALSEMADSALRENARFIDMDECVTPLIDVIDHPPQAM